MKRLHVAAGVIRGADGHVLIAKRPLDKHQGGLWEFPGGKVEEGETAEAALARELAEELGIAVIAARPLIQVRHDYPDKQVLLDVWERPQGRKLVLHRSCMHACDASCARGLLALRRERSCAHSP